MRHHFLTLAVPLTLLATTGLAAEGDANATVTLDTPTVEIPFTSFGNRPVVQVTLNDSGPYDFIVDTGATTTLIDAGLAEALDLQILERTSITTPAMGTPVPAGIARLARLQLRGVSVETLPVTVVELGKFFGTDTAPVGILPSTVFRDYLLTIDYPGQRVALREGALPKADGVHVLNFNDDDDLPAISVRFGSKTYSMHLDTGSPGALVLPVSAQQAIPLSTRPVQVGIARTLDREMSILAAPFEGKVTIGPITLENPRITFLDGIRVGNIGYQVLGRLSITLDRANHRLSLEEPSRPPATAATPTSPSTPKQQRRYGMAFSGLDGDRVQVAHVDAGSPAEAAGLLADDVIVSMNGSPLPDLDRNARIQALRASPLRVEVDRGGERLDLTLRLDEP